MVVVVVVVVVVVAVVVVVVVEVVEVAVVVALWRAFNRDQLILTAPLIRDEQDAVLD